jgi:DNA-binding MarR family transcriptional regulator
LSDDPIAFRVFNEIGIISQLAGTMFERVMPDGMTLAQFAVLNHFARLGGVKSPNELARAFQVTKGTMTSTLQRLDARGYIMIKADPEDGRGKCVSMTAKGAKARNAAIAALSPLIAKLGAHETAASFPALLPPLTALREFLDKERQGE